MNVVDPEFQNVINTYLKTVNELDIGLAQSLWDSSDEISFIHPRGHEKGWDQVREAFYLGTMGLFTSRELRVKEISVHRLSDDVAQAEFYWDFNAVFEDGTPLTTEGRETQVWKKSDGNWRIVHVHYSGPATVEEGEGF